MFIYEIEGVSTTWCVPGDNGRELVYSLCIPMALIPKLLFPEDSQIAMMSDFKCTVKDISCLATYYCSIITV